MKKYSQILRGFTLVELISVITIFAILSTVAFVSFQNYVKYSRDSNRLTTLKNVEKGLLAFQTVSSSFPLPDNKVSIFASGVEIGFQGNIAQSLSNLLKIKSNPTDPLDNSLLTYGVNGQKNKYQLLNFLEKTVSYFPQTYAIDINLRYPHSLGNELGIFLDANNIPIEQTGTGVDIVKTNNVYNVYLADGKTLSGTGNILYKLTSRYKFFASCKDISNFLSLSGTTTKDGYYNIFVDPFKEMEVYCDMTNFGGGWTKYVTIKGNYKYTDSLDCYNGKIVNNSNLYCFSPVSSNPSNILVKKGTGIWSIPVNVPGGSATTARTSWNQRAFFDGMYSSGSATNFFRLGADYNYSGSAIRQYGGIASYNSYMNFAANSSAGDQCTYIPSSLCRETNAQTGEIYFK